MPELSKEQREHIDEQTNQRSAQQGIQTNRREVAERKFNPSFLRRIQDADLDSDLHDWLEAEFPALFSGAHIVGQRSGQYEAQQEFLNRAKAERYIAETSPGALLQRHPGVHASMAGTTPEQAIQPITSDEKRVVRDAMEVATARQGLAVGARGLRSVTTATSETRTVRHEDGEDDDGVLSRASGVLG
jgi:hypothetical protein